jgi:hypothetical protein
MSIFVFIFGTIAHKIYSRLAFFHFVAPLSEPPLSDHQAEIEHLGTSTGGVTE